MWNLEASSKHVGGVTESVLTCAPPVRGWEAERRFWISSPGTGLLTKQPPYGKCIPEHAHNKTQDYTEML